MSLDANIYKRMKNANVPRVSQISTPGMYDFQVNGMRFMVNEIGMITYRSMYMAILINNPMVNMRIGVLRIFLFHNVAQGISTLKINIKNHIHPKGPLS